MTFGRGVLQTLEGIEGLVKHRLTASAGPLTLSVGFASTTLRDACALSFIETSTAEPDARLTLVSRRELDLSGVIPWDRSQGQVFSGEDGYVFWQPGPPDILFAVDYRTKRAMTWINDTIAPPWEASRPGLPCIAALLSQTSWLLVHGAGVGWQGRQLLFVGAGRAGKTTTALACARAGWSYAGDDAVLVNSAAKLLSPLYASARLRVDMACNFQALADASGEPSRFNGDPRHELSLRRLMPETKFCGGPLEAIFIVRRRGAERPVIAPARRVDAMQAMLTSSLQPTPGWRRRMTQGLIALLGKMPIFFIDTGPVVDAIPDALANYLDRMEGPLDCAPQA